MSQKLPSGLWLINKPAGPTSHDIVNQLRRLTGVKKIGHAGTLDPFASGLLICAVGREATKRLNQFSKLSKEYEAVFILGANSDTYDKTGQIIQVTELPLTKAEIERALQKFVGQIKQVPPMYSAKKINGRKLYKLARAGQIIERSACSIAIYQITILACQWPKLNLKIKCSAGTYIRSLAFDLGQVLGCGAYVEELVRIAIGPWRLEQAISPEQVKIN